MCILITLRLDACRWNRAASAACIKPRRLETRSEMQGPLQYDVQSIVRKILTTVCDAATATRTAAEREETRIYTHFEGWLPDEEERPTVAWSRRWCRLGIGLLNDTKPAATPAAPLSTIRYAPNPQFDPTNAQVAERIRQRNLDPSY